MMKTQGSRGAVRWSGMFLAGWLLTAMALPALLPWSGRALWAALVLGMVLVGGMDNVLRPALVSGKTQMNGLVVFISILGGVTAFGFVGLVLGPVVAAAIISLLELGTVGVAPGERTE